MTKRKLPAVWTLEGKWGPTAKEPSATRWMEFLRDQRVLTIRGPAKQVGPRGLQREIRDWARSDSPICYLACHGDSSGELRPSEYSLRGLLLGTDLVDVARWIGDDGGRDKVLVLGSCKTLGNSAMASALLRATSLTGVLGYTNSVDTIETAAFEMLLITELARAYAKSRTPGPRTLEQAAHRAEAIAGLPRKSLRFVAHWRDTRVVHSG